MTVVPGAIAKSPALAPIVDGVTVSGDVPTFCTVMVCAALVVPTRWLPNDSDGVGIAMSGFTPVPLSVGAVTEAALSASVASTSVDDFAPAEDGAKRTVTGVEPP